MMLWKVLHSICNMQYALNMQYAGSQHNSPTPSRVQVTRSLGVPMDTPEHHSPSECDPCGAGPSISHQVPPTDSRARDSSDPTAVSSSGRAPTSAVGTLPCAA